MVADERGAIALLARSIPTVTAGAAAGVIGLAPMRRFPTSRSVRVKERPAIAA